MLLMSQLFKGKMFVRFTSWERKKNMCFNSKTLASVASVEAGLSKTEAGQSVVLVLFWCRPGPVWWCFVVVYFFEKKNNNPVDFHSKSVSLSLKYSRILQSYFQIVHNVHNMMDSCWMYIIHIYKQKKIVWNINTKNIIYNNMNIPKQNVKLWLTTILPSRPVENYTLNIGINF